MAYVISGSLDDDRVVRVVRDRRLVREFFFPLACGTQPSPELLARTPNPYFVIPPNKAGIPEIFGGELGVWTIKDSVREIIEQLEPDVHSFIPVNLRVRGTEVALGRYYLLLPGQAINAVVMDETHFVGGKGRMGFEVDPTLSPFGDTVLKAELIAGRHLWRGEWGRSGKVIPFAEELFCSSELVSRIRESDLEGWEFRQCRSKFDGG